MFLYLKNNIPKAFWESKIVSWTVQTLPKEILPLNIIQSNGNN